ncbi:hypothetical protein P8843_06965 [Bacillus inaquosorum]|uniref:hypothetical protein n=1 Tax=Bacillus TaxID=1386 RepID=UPI0007726BBF|nr:MULTISPECIES: hypothetical protein [Bacillus subtilis group]KXJ35318.1 hypothetical protein AX282_06230 [Bacillus spizizenii]MBL4968958.1 hypothetical protein [Bacillus halotolerans]MBL4973021.1 hypothetical protein [Bacillus halotolerans]MBL4978815.1 hypothetical protein [Bacillus halotolerans]MCY7757821.1 hypothetical protein [Bacillus inaquosorum]
MKLDTVMDMRESLAAIIFSVGSENILSGEYYIEIDFQNKDNKLTLKIDRAALLDLRDKINETLWKIDDAKSLVKSGFTL